MLVKRKSRLKDSPFTLENAFKSAAATVVCCHAVLLIVNMIRKHEAQKTAVVLEHISTITSRGEAAGTTSIGSFNCNI